MNTDQIEYVRGLVLLGTFFLLLALLLRWLA